MDFTEHPHFLQQPMSQDFNHDAEESALADVAPDWHWQLRQLVQQVCQHPDSSRERRKGFNQIVRMIQQSGKLWRDSSPYYEDALQQMWLHFSRNLCEATTVEQPYCSEDCFIIARLNQYLKRRLQDYATAAGTEAKRRAPQQITHEGEVIDPVDQIPAPVPVPSLLDAVQAWVEADETGELRGTHVKGRPEVNCQMLILRRLPPETGWKVLAAEFSISIATLSGFYERECRPRLRQFGQSEGYL